MTAPGPADGEPPAVRTPGPAAPAAPPGTDMPRFIREQMAFVGLDDADLQAIRGSAPLVLAHEATITAGLYDHLLAFPATARFFLSPDGTVDEPRLERRKHTLGRWLRETVEVVATQEFSYYLLAVGLSHSHRPEVNGGPVPAPVMVGAMSLVQTVLADLFRTSMEAAEAVRVSAAWNKLLLVQLAVLLLGYLRPPHRA